jgi:hypothetical protein
MNSGAILGSLAKGEYIGGYQAFQALKRRFSAVEQGELHPIQRNQVGPTRHQYLA